MVISLSITQNEWELLVKTHVKFYFIEPKIHAFLGSNKIWQTGGSSLGISIFYHYEEVADFSSELSLNFLFLS